LSLVRPEDPPSTGFWGLSWTRFRPQGPSCPAKGACLVEDHVPSFLFLGPAPGICPWPVTQGRGETPLPCYLARGFLTGPLSYLSQIHIDSPARGKCTCLEEVFPEDGRAGPKACSWVPSPRPAVQQNRPLIPRGANTDPERFPSDNFKHF